MTDRDVDLSDYCPICGARPGDPCAEDCPGMDAVWYPQTLVDEDEGY